MKNPPGIITVTETALQQQQPLPDDCAKHETITQCWNLFLILALCNPFKLNMYIYNLHTTKCIHLTLYSVQCTVYSVIQCLCYYANDHAV